MNELFKFGHDVNGHDTPYRHNNTYAVENMGEDKLRLRIAPNSGHVGLLLHLASKLPEPYGVLYVLLVPRNGHQQEGRYQSPFLNFEELSGFMLRFQTVFEGDGRAHVWIASIDEEGEAIGTLIYDKHDVIFAYGPIKDFEELLVSKGLRKAEPTPLPIPHTHHYNFQYDEDVVKLMDTFEWRFTALRPADDL